MLTLLLFKNLADKKHFNINSTNLLLRIFLSTEY
jgi:hypothetical protein